jgi:tetratricopeptide (TPR) repeat protein
MWRLAVSVRRYLAKASPFTSVFCCLACVLIRRQFSSFLSPLLPADEGRLVADWVALAPATTDAQERVEGSEAERALSYPRRLRSACCMFQEALAKRRRILGEEYPDIISAMNNLADILGDQGKLDETAAMKQEVLAKRRRILGEEHPSTISAMNNLAITLSDQGKLDEAAIMFEETVARMSRILGATDP